MHHEQSVYGINPLFFEILGSNSLHFVDRKPFIEEYFPDYNIYTYTTEEDLFDMIGQKFINDIPWEDQTLYSTINKHHTYRNRVDYILERI
jgi:spore maturation protein CgeB